MANDTLLKQCSERNNFLFLINRKMKSSITCLLDGIKQDDEEALLRFHRLLAELNRQRFSTHNTPAKEQHLEQLCTFLEEAWLRLERAHIQAEVENVPQSIGTFCLWFEQLKKTGSGQNHPLFLYLAERATQHEFKFFFQQESITEAGFDDLVALTQLKATPQIKMELAHNYWDEMGRGNPKGVHAHLLKEVNTHLGLSSEEPRPDFLWEPLALSNLMIALATKRSRFHQSIGALGVIELTAPSRCDRIVQGLKRLGVPAEKYHYYALHATVDQKHWAGWKENAIQPLIEAEPDSIPRIAEGALLRLLAGKRCYDAYSRCLMLTVAPPDTPSFEVLGF